MVKFGQSSGFLKSLSMESPGLKDSRITLNTGNQVLFTFVLLIQILTGCAKKFLKVEEDNGAKFGKLSQTKELE